MLHLYLMEMALKRTIHEQCERCGQTAAVQESDGTVRWLAHRCPKGPPGPPDYPKRFRPNEVIFVPAVKEETRTSMPSDVSL